MKEEGKKINIKIDGKDYWMSKEVFDAEEKLRKERERKAIPKSLHKLFGL